MVSCDGFCIGSSGDRTFLCQSGHDSVEASAFVYTLTAIRWIVLASFIGWACRLRYVHGYSGFQGFTNQSMLIGPLGGISFIYSVYRYYLSSTVFDRYKEMGIAIVSIVVLLLAGSRSALGATFLAAVFYIAGFIVII